MITVTRFDHTHFILNADLIEFVESTPDTHITLVTGKKILVRESPEEIIDRVLEYRRLAGPLLNRPIPADVLNEISGLRKEAEF